MAWVEVDITDIDIDTDKIAQEVIGGLDIKSEVEELLRGGYGGIDLNDYIDGSDMRDTARDELFDNFDEALEDNDEFTELRRTVQRLVEHLALPEERTGVGRDSGLVRVRSNDSCDLRNNRYYPMQ